MRKAVLGSIAAITAGAGLAAGQSPRMPASMPAPVAVAPGGGVMPASMDGGMAMPPDAQPMMPPPGGMMPPGPYPGDPGMGMGGPPPGGGYGGAPVVDNALRLAPKFEFNGKYLYYFSKAQPSPGAILTTSAPGAFGILGQPSTSTFYGGDEFGMGNYSGFDLSGVLWRDPDRRIGFYAGGMKLEQKSRSAEVYSDGTGQPLLARPFLNAQTGLQDSLLVAFPNAIVGGMVAAATTEMYGAEGGYMFNIYRSCPTDCCLTTLNWHAGIKYAELNERLAMAQFSQLINGSVAVVDQKVYTSPAAFAIYDDVKTLNQFYGGQIGFTGDARYGRAFFSTYGKLGIGVMHNRLEITGKTLIRDTNTGANSTIHGGFLANSANIGKFNQDEFALVPEAGATIGYNWSSWFTTTLGYGFVYMENVIRPGDQISTTVNPALVPAHPAYGGSAVPVPNPAFTKTDFWAQGVQLGFIFRW